MSSDPLDPLDTARATVARIFLWVGLGGLAMFAATRDWRMLALAGAAWTLWGAIGGLLDGVASPFATIVANLLTGGSVGVGDSGPAVTIDEEMATLERRLGQDAPSHHRILAGIRLAEIYRTHQRDAAKADALIAQLCAQYPDAPELRFVRGA